MSRYEDAYNKLANALMGNYGTNRWIERSIHTSFKKSKAPNLKQSLKLSFYKLSSGTIFVVLIISNDFLLYRRWIEFTSKSLQPREDFKSKTLSEKHVKQIFDEAVADAIKNKGWKIQKLLGSKPLSGVDEFVKWLS